MSMMSIMYINVYILYIMYIVYIMYIMYYKKKIIYHLFNVALTSLLNLFDGFVLHQHPASFRMQGIRWPLLVRYQAT